MIRLLGEAKIWFPERLFLFTTFQRVLLRYDKLNYGNGAVDTYGFYLNIEISLPHSLKFDVLTIMKNRFIILVNLIVLSSSSYGSENSYEPLVEVIERAKYSMLANPTT